MDTIRVAERSQRALRFARNEAKRLGASKITADHLLLGLLNDGEGEVGPGVVTAVLASVAIEKAPWRDALCRPPEGDFAAGTDDPEDSDTFRSILESATSEAQTLGHGYVGAEHLLLGVIRSRSRASILLASAGLNLERARLEIRRLLGDAA
jgi:ATP-dependent Clp protease ATP-binding subunit ClpC